MLQNRLIMHLNLNLYKGIAFEVQLQIYLINKLIVVPINGNITLHRNVFIKINDTISDYELHLVVCLSLAFEKQDQIILNIFRVMK